MLNDSESATQAFAPPPYPGPTNTEPVPNFNSNYPHTVHPREEIVLAPPPNLPSSPPREAAVREERRPEPKTEAQRGQEYRDIREFAIRSKKWLWIQRTFPQYWHVVLKACMSRLQAMASEGLLLLYVCFLADWPASGKQIMFYWHETAANFPASIKSRSRKKMHQMWH